MLVGVIPPFNEDSAQCRGLEARVEMALYKVYPNTVHIGEYGRPFGGVTSLFLMKLILDFGTLF